jgi:hypothetical protein
MALAGTTVWEIRQTGADTNGGGWVPGSSGTDWSQQATPKYVVTDGVTNGTTTITSATAAWGADIVGNILYAQGGTGSVAASWYQVVSWTNATTIVVDRATGLTSGTGVTLRVGGCLYTIGGFGQVLAAVGVTGMVAWWKNAGFAYGGVNTNTPNVSNGTFSGPSGISFSIEGYDVTRGDRTGNRPIFKWNIAAPGSLTYMITAVGGPAARQQFVNATVDGASTNNVGGFNMTNTRASATQCVAQNFNGTGGIGFNASNTGIQGISCQANTCGTGFAGSGSGWLYCDAVSCSIGFSSGSNHNNCLARQCTNGFSSGTTGICFVNCTADGSTTNGFVTTQAAFFTNCLSTNTLGGSGVGFNVASLQATMTNCASYNNVTEISGTPLANEGMIYSASFTGGQPYTTAGTDFRPNATAGSGALLRAAGIGVYGQTDNVDIGAVQHSDPTGGGGAANLSRVFSGF